MVKTVKLTWGFSLCKLKVPSILFDTGLGKHSLSTTAALGVRNAGPASIATSQKRRLPAKTKQARPPDDVELALIINPPQLASQCLVSNKHFSNGAKSPLEDGGKFVDFDKFQNQLLTRD